MTALDQGLWTYRNDSFLPHGCEGDPAEHPVWLTAAAGNPNAADLLVLVDDALLDGREGFAGTAYLFDRRDPAMRDIARDRFAAFRDEGSRPVYLRFGPQGWPQSE
ncbi:MAG: DNA polymerase III subunit chi [Alphaproteobacteria bacterium]|nr:DNA polymerase III subunit chi [Alphaproteobacteria bacterium]